jgi:hypothetical protein
MLCTGDSHVAFRFLSLSREGGKRKKRLPSNRPGINELQRHWSVSWIMSIHGTTTDSSSGIINEAEETVDRAKEKAHACKRLLFPHSISSRLNVE